MTGAVTAGRLEVPVESDTSGFAQQLKRKLEAAIEEVSKNLAATVGVKVDGDRLRSKIEDEVDKAAEGVRAKVALTLGASTTLRKQMQKEVDEAQIGISAEIEVDVSGTGLRERLQEVVRVAAAGVRAHVLVDVDQTNTNVTGEDVVQTVTGRDGFTGWFRPWRKKRQEEADASPVQLGVAPQKEQGKFLTQWIANLKDVDRIGSMVARRAMMFVGIASVIQPAIAAIGGSLGGLLAMAGNLSTSLSVLAAAPSYVLGLVAVLGTGMIAFQGFTGELNDMPPAMRKAAKALRGFSDDWDALVVEVKERFWTGLAEPIKQTGEVLLPALRTGLAGAAGAMNGVATRFLEFARSTDFATNLQSLFTQINGDGQATEGVIVHLGAAFQNVFKGVMDLAALTGPLVDKLGDSLVRVTEKFAQKWDTDPERTSLAQFLDYAYDKGAQAVRVVSDLWDSITGIFSAARPTGDTLLGELEVQTAKLADWVNSPQGAAAIKQWFTDVAPIAREAGGLLVDAVKAILNLADDPSTANLISSLRTDLLPALEAFFGTLGESLGPAVISLFTELAELLANLGQSGGSLSAAVEGITGILSAVNDFLSANPGAADTIGSVVAALVGFSALKPLLAKTGVLSLLGATLSGIAGSIAGLKGAKISLPTVTGGGTAAAGALGGAASGAGKTSFLSKMFSTQVYWNAAMPVFVTNMPASFGGGGGVDTIVDGPDGAGKTTTGTTPKVGRLSKFGTSLRSGASRLLGGLTLGRLGGNRAASTAVTGVLESRGLSTLGNGVARNTITSAVTNAANPGRLARIGGTIRGAASATASQLRGAATYGAAGIRAGATRVASGLSGAASGAVSRLKSVNWGSDAGFLDLSAKAGQSATASTAASTAARAATSTASGAAKASKGLLSRAGSSLVSLVKGGGGKSTGLLGGLFGKSTAKTVGTKLLSGAGKLAKVGGGVGAIAGIAGDMAGQALKDGNGGVRDAAGSALSGAAQGAGMGAMIGSVIPGVGTAIGGVAGGIIGGGMALAQSGVDWSKVGDELGNSWAKVQDVIGVAVGKIGGFFSMLWDVAKQVFAWTPLGLVVTNWDAIIGWFQEFGAKVGGFFSMLWDVAKQLFAWTPLGLVITNWDSIIGWFQELPGKIGGFLGTVWAKAKEIFSWSPLGLVISNWDTIIGWFGGLPAKISAVAGGMWNGITSSFKGALNGVISAWNGLSFTVPGVTVFGKTIGGFTLNTPNLPFLKKGGWLRRGGAAVVGDAGPEILDLPAGARVTPLGGSQSSLARLLQSGASARSDATSSAGSSFTFAEGSIKVYNPVAEPASTSISASLRRAAALVTPMGATA